MGANIVDVPGNGPYVFKVQGQTYHRNGEISKFAHLYILETRSPAADLRKQLPENENCDPDILYRIDNFMRNHNRLANSYLMMRDVQKEHEENSLELGLEIPVVNMVFKRDRRSDQRRYNKPTENEVAMVFVNNDGEPPFERDIRIYPKKSY